MEGLKRRKVLIVVDFESEDDYDCHGSELALDLDIQISKLGKVHDLTVYEQDTDKDFTEVMMEAMNDLKDGNI